MKKLRKAVDSVEDSIEAYACSCSCYGCGCYCSNEKCGCSPSNSDVMATAVVNVLQETSYLSRMDPQYDTFQKKMN